MTTTRVHVLVSGRVQGVWFRSSTRDEAARRGLTGWVRNLPDGRVEAEVQGPADAVRDLLAFVAQGPPAARVTDIATWELPPVAHEEGFAQR